MFKILLSTVLVLALTSLSLGKSIGPLDDSDATSRNVVVKNDEGEDVSLSPKEFILFYTIIGFRDISQDYVHNAANISVHMLKDNILKVATSPMIKEFYHNITEFMDGYKQMDDLEDLFTLVEEYSETTSHYYELTPGTATLDQLAIEAKLREYDSDDLDKKFEENFEEFVQGFLVKLNKFQSSLNSEELQIGNNLNKWTNEFKQITNTEEKIAAFAEFFKILGA